MIQWTRKEGKTLMSEILNHIHGADTDRRGIPSMEIVLRRTVQHVNEAEEQRARDLRGKIILDPKKDPDPWGLHGISLRHRLLCMGWEDNQ